jgi:hypothetical protein
MNSTTSNINKSLDNRPSLDLVQKLTDLEFRKTSLLARNFKHSNYELLEDYKMDFSPFLNRYFRLGEFNFTTNDLIGSEITLIENFPYSIFSSNTQIENLLKYATLFRVKCYISVSLSGTISHQGTLLVGCLPPVYRGQGLSLISAYLMTTSGFLYANEATSLELLFPWYSAVDFDRLPFGETGEGCLQRTFGSLKALVVSQLSASEGSSTSLTITVQVRFQDLDTYVPNVRPTVWMEQQGLNDVVSKVKKATSAVFDVYDKTIGPIASLVGLHNPNVPISSARHTVVLRNDINMVEGEQHLERIDPYADYLRITDDMVFNSDCDEMNLNVLLSREVFVGKFIVDEIDSAGTFLFSRPIAPIMSLYDPPIVDIGRFLYYSSQGWSGEITLKMRSNMTNKHQFKIAVVRYYCPPANILQQHPRLSDVVNNMTQYFEFTAGGQTHEVTLPYLSRLPITSTSLDSDFAGLFHGVVMIYLIQPLVRADGTPTSVSVNCYADYSKVQFYGYPHFVTMVPQALESDILVMNEPQHQETNSVEEPSATCTRLRPILSIRDIIRRMYLAYTSIFSEAQINHFVIDIAEQVFRPQILGSTYNPLTHAASIYTLFQGNVKFRFVLNVPHNFTTGEVHVMARVRFIPPIMSFNGYDYSSAKIAAPYYFDRNGFVLAEQNLSLTSSSTFIIEGVVPNMNLCKAVLVDKLENSSNYLSSLGHLVLTFSNPITIPNSRLELFLGFSDESRLGMCSKLPYFPATLSGNYETPYVNDDNTLFNVVKPSGMYYSKT